MTHTTNSLSKASSPYLLQHAHNPVEWYEWGDEALKKAKDENKPLLISIGYAACHWCHVMAHESFEDSTVAAYMNAHFINIKIDREERPDIDQIYMEAAQLITGRGGWPLNAFTLPDGRPFYAGTYFPKDSWMNLLQQIVGLYQDDIQKLEDQAAALTEGINKHDFEVRTNGDNIEFKKDKYNSLYRSYEKIIDFKLGGFNRAPKFPLPVSWEFLLQYNHLNKEPDALKAVNKTLTEMAKGGIYDQVGGGFARYSVDEFWKAPHFEKMLYDNGQLVSLYAHAYQTTKNPYYEYIIRQTLGFVERELINTEGGFYSSLDADSEGEEGLFYVWKEETIDSVLGDDVNRMIKNYYQVTPNGNWEHGNNILHSRYTPFEFEVKNEMQTGGFLPILKEANTSLLLERATRIRPGTDDKILTSWNALMLVGYIDAYKALGDEAYLQTALQNAHFLEKMMLQQDGSLWRNVKDGKPSISAFLDDYALLAEAFLELYQVTFDKHWLDQSKLLADYSLEHFSDDLTSLFFYTSDQAETLIARKHEVPDNVIPSSNSVLAIVLYKLGLYFDESPYIDRARGMLSQVENEAIAGGPYYANWQILYGLITYGVFEVAILGEEAMEKALEVQKHFNPNAIFLGGTEENLGLLESKLISGRTLIYVCINKVCQLPVENSADAVNQLIP